MKLLFPIAEDPLYSSAFSPIDSNMYLLLHDKQALIIDPCEDQEAVDHLKEKGIDEILILLTHEHFDHISGVNDWRKHFSKVRVLCSKPCAQRIPLPRKNLSQYFPLLFCMQDEDIQQQVLDMQIEPYCCEADEFFEKKKEFSWNGHHICLVETPGHSMGSICITIDQAVVFTGDSLVQGTPVVTRLPGGNRESYAKQTMPYLSSLCGEMVALPGHGFPEKLAKLLKQEKEYAAL